MTAYNSTIGQTDSTPCISADASNICKRYAKGEKICASNSYPLGSRLYVDGYGECTVADRMNRRYKDRVDVYFGKDVKRARNWGRRKTNVEHIS